MASMIQKSNLNVYHVLNMLFIFEVMFRISAAFLFLFDITLAKNITAIFVFGDSMVDVGNNNYIKTIAKAAFPNGIDFGLRGSSGRFTNGRTVIDILGKLASSVTLCLKLLCLKH